MRGNRPSRTAIKIGKGMVFIAQDPQLRVLLPNGAAEWSDRLVTESGVLTSWERSLYGKPWFRKFAAFMERYTLPGATLHMALRKRFLDEETRAAIRDGAVQVLVVGAGLDTLCLRLAAEFPQVTFVEVDHPNTQSVKRAGVETIGTNRPNLHLLPVDLASSRLEDAVSAGAPWRTDATSVVVAEGLLMYLAESDVTALLEGARRIMGMGSRLLLTYLPTDQAGRIRLGKFTLLMRMSLKMVGEPLRWALPQDEMPAFLRQRGYRLDTSRERYDFRHRFLEPHGMESYPLGDVELVGVAETCT